MYKEYFILKSTYNFVGKLIKYLLNKIANFHIELGNTQLHLILWEWKKGVMIQVISLWEVNFPNPIKIHF